MRTADLLCGHFQCQHHPNIHKHKSGKSVFATQTCQLSCVSGSSFTTNKSRDSLSHVMKSRMSYKNCMAFQNCTHFKLVMVPFQPQPPSLEPIVISYIAFKFRFCLSPFSCPFFSPEIQVFLMKCQIRIWRTMNR